MLKGPGGGAGEAGVGSCDGIAEGAEAGTCGRADATGSGDEATLGSGSGGAGGPEQAARMPTARAPLQGGEDHAEAMGLTGPTMSRLAAERKVAAAVARGRADWYAPGGVWSPP